MHVQDKRTYGRQCALLTMRSSVDRLSINSEIDRNRSCSVDRDSFVFLLSHEQSSLIELKRETLIPSPALRLLYPYLPIGNSSPRVRLGRA